MTNSPTQPRWYFIATLSGGVEKGRRREEWQRVAAMLNSQRGECLEVE